MVSGVIPGLGMTRDLLEKARLKRLDHEQNHRLPGALKTKEPSGTNVRCSVWWLLQQERYHHSLMSQHQEVLLVML